LCSFSNRCTSPSSRRLRAEQMAPRSSAHRGLAAALCTIGAATAAVDSKGGAGAHARIHMVTYTTGMYRDRFADSLKAKEAYARHWGYEFEVFDEVTLACGDFREVRWRGDQRYCKLEALEVMWHRIKELQKSDPSRQDYLFWHDVDTHIMRPETPLQAFVEAGGAADVIFTDNALSLNNGVFFLKTSRTGRSFLRRWRDFCQSGEWPWADNGCMYEFMLQHLGGARYSGRCKEYSASEFNPDRPELLTGTELMRCFNDEMDALGMGCCGDVSRGVGHIRFLTGVQDAFNHHPCDQLEKDTSYSKAWPTSPSPLASWKAFGGTGTDLGKLLD